MNSRKCTYLPPCSYQLQERKFYLAKSGTFLEKFVVFQLEIPQKADFLLRYYRNVSKQRYNMTICAQLSSFHDPLSSLEATVVSTMQLHYTHCLLFQIQKLLSIFFSLSLFHAKNRKVNSLNNNPQKPRRGFRCLVRKFKSNVQFTVHNIFLR